MKVQTPIRSLLIIGMAVGLAQLSAWADDAASVFGLGSLRGVTLDASGKPLSRVEVVIGSADGGAGRNVVSDVDGEFNADRLIPGVYRITATKVGLAGAAATTVLVAKDHVTRASLVLVAADSTPAATATPTPAATAPPAPTPTPAPAATAAPLTIEQELQAMKDRIAALEAELKARPAAVAAPAAATPPPP